MRLLFHKNGATCSLEKDHWEESLSNDMYNSRLPNSFEEVQMPFLEAIHRKTKSRHTEPLDFEFSLLKKSTKFSV